MSPTKIDPQSVYKKNQSEISWGPGGGSSATWQGEGVEKAWQDAQDWFGYILLGGRKNGVSRVDPSYLPGISWDDNPN